MKIGKIEKHPAPCFERLIRTVALDDTKYNMQCVHFDRKRRYAIATDGHRLFASKPVFESFEFKLKEEGRGDCVRADILAQTHECVPLDVGGKWIDYWHVVPKLTDYKNVVGFDVPSYFKKFRGLEDMAISFHLDGTVRFGGSPDAWKQASQTEITVSAAYLAEFGGDGVRLWWKDSKSPLVVTQISDQNEDLFKHDWFAVIMPRRESTVSTSILRSSSPKTEEPKAEQPKKEDSMEKENVVAFRPRPAKPAAQNLLKCPHCEHEVEEVADWSVGLDMVATKDWPAGIQDSGKLMCPECEEPIGATLVDGLVTFTEHGEMAGIGAFIPLDTIKEVADQMAEDGVKSSGGEWYFNPGTMILNAVKGQLQKALGARADYVFPADKHEKEAANG